MNNFENPYFVILVIYVFIIGLCIGSFLNVVILRGLSGENIVYIPSKCPKCNNKLKWYMNIPLISYLFLRGKCAYCHEPISIQYPLVEFATALLFCCAFVKFGFEIKLLFILAALSMFIVMAVEDIKETVIVDIHAYILAVVGIIYSCFTFSNITIIQSIIGGICGFLFFEAVSFITKKIINYRAFGEGDSLIALGLGTFFGLKAVPLLIVLSFIIQFVFAIPFLVKDAFSKNKIKLALSYILITLGVVFYAAVNYINLAKNNYNLYLIFVLVISAVMVYSLVILLKDLSLKTKENNKNEITDELESSFFALPFGPAMIISGILYLFYCDFIYKVVKNFFISI